MKLNLLAATMLLAVSCAAQNNPVQNNPAQNTSSQNNPAQNNRAQNDPPQNNAGQKKAGPVQQPSRPMQNMDEMDGMMPGNGAQQRPAMQMPKDMQAPTAGDAAARSETQSLRASEQQQRRQQGARPGVGSDRESEHADTFSLQEREAPGMRTGDSASAPDLLEDVAARPPRALASFLALARRTNPTLGQTAEAVTRAQQQARQAGLPPDPVVGYRGDHIRGGSYNGGEQGAFVQQTFVLGGKLGLRRKMYTQQAAANQIGVVEQQYRVDGTIEQDFYHALAAQAGVIVHQRMLRVALDAQQTAHQLSNLGQQDAPDVLQAEVEAEQAQVAFVTAQRMFLDAFATLAADAGEPALAPAPLEGDLEAPPALDITGQIAQTLKSSPQIRRAEQQVLVAEARLKDARREAVPDLDVKAGEWYSGEELGATSTETGPMAFAEAGMDLPLWNRNQGNVGAAKAELQQAQDEVLRTRLMLARQTATLEQNYRIARFTAERYRTELLPRARRAYQLYAMKYQQMSQSYPQVLLSQRTLFELQAAYLGALEREWSTELSLRNFTLSGGLQMPMDAGSQATDLNLPDAAQ